jgi:hypothetical protein
MKRKRLSTVLLLAVALGLVAFTVVKMRSTGADVSTQGSEPTGSEQLDSEPSESVFGPHSYTLPPDYEFAPPPEDLPPPAISRDEIIARGQARVSVPIASVDLVTVVDTGYRDPPITGRQWLVVVPDFVSVSLGGPMLPPDSPCAVPLDQKPPSCPPFLLKGTLIMLYDAETGELTEQDFGGRPHKPLR